jgi:hypothetical protein
MYLYVPLMKSGTAIWVDERPPATDAATSFQTPRYSGVPPEEQVIRAGNDSRPVASRWRGWEDAVEERDERLVDHTLRLFEAARSGSADVGLLVARS